MISNELFSLCFHSKGILHLMLMAQLRSATFLGLCGHMSCVATVLDSTGAERGMGTEAGAHNFAPFMLYQHYGFLRASPWAAVHELSH